MTCVLIVDDEPIVRDVVVRYLEQAGFDTRQAEDGVAARELLEQKMPNAIVLDLMMPRMDGSELCRWIRARSDVPVIMLTALGEEADRIVGLELGADDDGRLVLAISDLFSSRQWRLLADRQRHEHAG